MGISTASMAEMTLSMEQLDNMRHAIGYEPTTLRKGQTSYAMWRNYFICSRANNGWEDLVQRGLASAKTNGSIVCYHVLPAGLDVLKYIYHVRFVEVP